MNTRAISLGDLISTTTLEQVDAIRTRFTGAEPFPHVTIDGFLTDSFVGRLLADFPRKDDRYRAFCLQDDGTPGDSYANGNFEDFPPAYRELDALMQNSAFLALVTQLTGIPGLEYDPDYFGGGIRESSGRVFLPPHIDFNHHPRQLTHRRLNLLLYLNPEWNAEWGGNLEVHLDPRVNPTSLVHSYAPILNRALIFETSEISWHGFDHLKPPPGFARRAFTIYFYTKDRPDGVRLHNTEYVEPPLPARFTAGYTLAKEDLELLIEGYNRRDGRIEMLYTLRREADEKYAHVWREYEYYFNEWNKLRGSDPSAD
jgi:2OG-Fe(II) oxygenase superfamily